MNEKVPTDVKTILNRSGFDCISALEQIDEAIILEIEQYANENDSVLEETSYQNMKKFKFKPGHKVAILCLADQTKKFKQAESNQNKQCKVTDVPFILKTFIDTMETNNGKDPKGYRYNDANRYFSIFVYLLCGKACYETLSANLPIPRADTIRKFSIFSLKGLSLTFKYF